MYPKSVLNKCVVLLVSILVMLSVTVSEAQAWSKRAAQITADGVGTPALRRRGISMQSANSDASEPNGV
jgi:hypothetical protein